MKLEDGIYEVENLFYENCKFVVVAAQNDIEFAHDASRDKVGAAKFSENVKCETDAD